MKLPIGISDFREIVEGKYEFVDKSLFIQDIIDDAAKVILITRPRRFGKTLQLSMLKYFFSNDGNIEGNKKLFDNLQIVHSKSDVLTHQGKYPVIFISFKDIKDKDFNNAYDKIYELIIRLFDEFSYLAESEFLSPQQKEFFKIILTRKASQPQLENALFALVEYLSLHHKINPIVLIDEYDTPIQQGKLYGYYDDVIGFIRNLFGSALKDNPYLFKAVLTGILRISKESLFSGLNNIRVYTLLHSRYNQYFGFIESEVLKLLKKAKMEQNIDLVRIWYNGYQFGNLTLYNPWSIINYIADEGRLQPYWVNTSDNALIKDLILNSTFDFKSRIELLLQDIPFETIIDDHIVFQYLNANETAVWTLFVMAGYLKVIAQNETDQGLFCSLAIPNREVRNLYRRIIETWLSDGRALNWYNQFLQELLNGNVERVQKYLSDILLQVASIYDMAREPEAFYHGLMLGLTASLYNEYEVKSNREAGFGFYDIVIIPKDSKKLGIVIELKIAEDTQLEKVAKDALQQIHDRQYATELDSRGIKGILKLGIAFSKKRLEIASKMN